MKIVQVTVAVWFSEVLSNALLNLPQTASASKQCMRFSQPHPRLASPLPSESSLLTSENSLAG